MNKLSKSSFLLGLKCKKALYLKNHHNHLSTPISQHQKNIFNSGNKIGLLAQKLFKNGHSSVNNDDPIAFTQQLINQGVEVIYEAAFCFNQLVCYVDILVKKEDKWHIYEVKSATKISKSNISDLAFQYYVLTKCGLTIDDASIINIDNSYVRKEKLFLEKMFKITSLHESIILMQKQIDKTISELLLLEEQKSIPSEDIGPKCSSPHDCIFKSHCWKNIPEYSIFDISRLSPEIKWEMYGNYIVELEDVPITSTLNEKQKMEIDAYVNDKSFVDVESLKKFLSSISSKVYFLDFETYQSAIPDFYGTKPYQQIPFQYSAHYLDENKELQHFDFLADTSGDNREQFIRSLIKDLSFQGDILVYNISFERGRLVELSKAFPQYKDELDKIINRMIDLIIPFKERWFYNSKMKGKNSIKNVLPALVPGFSYDSLKINNGILASQSFYDLSNVKDKNEVLEIRKNLLEYCKLDTLAMVKIFEVLKNAVS